MEVNYAALGNRVKQLRKERLAEMIHISVPRSSKCAIIFQNPEFGEICTV